jgi:lactose/cellobiose-specific phosphotransferase system IIC component
MDKFDAFVSQLANLPSIRALRRGLLYLTPLILIGSIILALLNLPIPAYQNFMGSVFGVGWRDIGLAIHKGTLQIVALLSLITVSYAMANEKELVKSGEVDPITIVITAFASYVVFTNDPTVLINASDAGSTGMFRALIISELNCSLFCILYKFRDRISPSDQSSYNGSALIRASFRAVIPALLTILVFAVADILLHFIGLAGGESILLKIISKIWAEQNFFSVLLIILVTQILWFLGIHGGNVVMDAMASGAPVAASAAGAPIFTKEFYDTYVYLGGAGATLGLLIALLLVGRNSSENRLAKDAIVPGIFNINEIMIYGLPIIFNPYFAIPFICSPVVLGFTSWVSVSLGWVPLPTQAVQWTTPVFLSGYLSTGSVAGVVLQAVNLALAVLIYVPFIQMQQRHQQRVRLSVFQNLGGEMQHIQEQQRKNILNRHDDTGALARALIKEIKEGLAKDSVPLHLEYQPKVNQKGEVIGAEALLRWNHPVYGYVSPLIILGSCDEAGLTNELGRWIMHQAFSDLKRWHNQGLNKLSLSVNLSPRQLKEDESLVQTVQFHINRLGIDPRYLELELTENAAIDPSDTTRSKLESIRNLEVNLSIDDFGMGHSSLLYICNFYANVIKLDAALVQAVTNDSQRQQIVKSILTLCAQLNVKAIAEGVETREQAQVLYDLGCQCFQGFYFSRSLNCVKFIEYVEQHGMADI